MRRYIALFLTLSALGSGTALAVPGLPDVEGPDVPPVGPADAVVTVVEDERWSYSEGERPRAVRVPVPPGGVAWDRIVLEYSSRPDGDPWDRLFWVRVGGVEVLRGTTPRTEFRLERDITQYSMLLPPGERVIVAAGLGSWVGALLATVRLRFYEDEVAARGPLDAVVPALQGALYGAGSKVEHGVLFPDAAPQKATVEVFLSGHGQAGEFWYLYGGPPDFHVFVDGVEVATVTALPYVYALAGIQGGEQPGGIHKYVWWTAQEAADRAGVHTGDGEIPPYRAVLDLDASLLGLLRGARTVKITQTERRVLAGGQSWPVSVSFLLDGVTDNCLEVANPDQADADADGVGDACDGPKLSEATGVQDGGPLAEPDVVMASYPGAVACEGADPAQFSYGGALDPSVTAVAVSCDGQTVRVGFPSGMLSPGTDGVLRYREGSVAAARVRAGGQEAANADAEAVPVRWSDRPVITWAAGLADPSKADEVTVYYQEPVHCFGVSPEQFVYASDAGRVAATGLACTGQTYLKVWFPDGTVDAKPPNPVLVYTAAPDGFGAVEDGDGFDAVSPDEQRVSV